MCGKERGKSPEKWPRDGSFLSDKKLFFSTRPEIGTLWNMAALSAWFWNERFWLPHNVTWADLADPAPGVEYPKAGHLFAALPLALGIFAVRILFERFVLATRVGCFLVGYGQFSSLYFKRYVWLFFHKNGMMGLLDVGGPVSSHCVLTLGFPIFFLSNTMSSLAVLLLTQ